MSAFLGYLGSFLIGALEWIIRIFLVIAFLALIYPLLPADPFRAIILSFRSVVQPFAALIDWLLPVRYIATSTLFWVGCKVFFVVYKIVASAIGIHVTDSMADTD